MSYELVWELRAGINEEQQHHVIRAIQHLMFFRDMYRAVGEEQRERAMECPWEYGAFEEYYGWSAYEGYASHLNQIMHILDVPGERADVEGGYLMDESDQRCVGVWGEWKDEVVDSSEEELLVTFYGTAEEMGKIAASLLLVNPRHYADTFSTMQLAPEMEPAIQQLEAGTLAEHFVMERIRENEHATKVEEYGPQTNTNLTLVLPMMGMDPDSLYNGLFADLITAWKKVGRTTW